jgi:hypothetical protein
MPEIKIQRRGVEITGVEPALRAKRRVKARENCEAAKLDAEKTMLEE